MIQYGHSATTATTPGPLEHATHDLGLGGRLATFTNQIVSTNSVGTVTTSRPVAAQRCLVSASDSSHEWPLAPERTRDGHNDDRTTTPDSLLTLDVGKLIQSVSTTVSVK